MRSRPMTHETRAEWRYYAADGSPSGWQPIDRTPELKEWVESGNFPTRTVERWVTEWTEVYE